ncbi:MAG: glycosyltransferase [Phycisphaeraceae bacterium]|nr:glycosyltransferase [Phycisphaeraceae bacterium]
MIDERSLSVVVLSFNRREALRRTLRELSSCEGAGAELIVVDNGSGDRSAEMVRNEFPGARLVALEHNVGVAGFNRGVDHATRDIVLILDDDAWPTPGAIARSLALFQEEAGLGGLMLHRRHPGTGRFEWPFECVDEPRRSWPDMGCANMVRAEVWRTVGGYEEAFFLYRNDTDLALKILGAGFDVAFDPELLAWHDSPAVDRKTPRWFEWSTRNWVWMCRRHARGRTRWAGVLMGWAWAHRLAAWSPRRHLKAFKGGVAGLARSAPPLPDTVRQDETGLRRLLRLKRTLRGNRSAATRRAIAARGDRFVRERSVR